MPVCLPEDIYTWITKHIKTPIKGFDHKRRRDGGYLSPEEQVTATQYQVMYIAQYFLEQGKSENEVIHLLMLFTE